MISFSHGPIESKKLDDLPEIYQGNEKIVSNFKPNWKVTRYQEELSVGDCALWRDFSKTYSRQLERVELKQEQLRSSMKREKERIEQEALDRENERVGSFFSF